MNSTDKCRSVPDQFNRRFDAAMEQAPAAKRRTRRALHRLGAERCPVRLKRMTRDLLGGAFDNAYLLAPDIPPANLVAMFEACHS